INLSATAIDGDGINRVEFYQGNTLVATSTNGAADGSTPYTAVWSNVAAGSYTLAAKAFDSLGMSKTSTPVHVSVSAGSGPAAAAFLSTDPTTLGNWKGVYGADGF